MFKPSSIFAKEVSVQSKRISIFLPSLMGGGAERVMVTLANEFVGRGIGVDFVLAKYEGPYLKDLDPDIRVINLNASRLAFSLIPLVKYFRKEKPEVMLSALCAANCIAIIARFISGHAFRLVVSERAVTSVATADNPLLRAKFVQLLMRVSYRKADAIIAVSSGVADDLVQNFKVPRSQINVVYNPVVTDELIELSLMRGTHEWLDCKKIPVVIGIGRLTSQKNFPLLIKAFALLLDRQDARLIILGEGKLKSELENLVRDLGIIEKIYFPGFVSNPFKWLRSASLFVLSSDYEGLPGTLIQAMACGTPVISTDCPSGPKEILENGKWGRLVPLRNTEALSHAMLQTLNESEHPNVELRAQFFGVANGVDGYLKLLRVLSS